MDMLLCKYPDNTFGCNITEYISGYFRNTGLKNVHKASMVLSINKSKFISFNIMFNNGIVGKVDCNNIDDKWIINDIKLDIDYDLSYYIGYELVFAKTWLN